MTGLDSAIQATWWMGCAALVIGSACLKINPGFDGESSNTAGGATEATIGSGPMTGPVETSSTTTAPTGSATIHDALTSAGTSAGSTTMMSSGTGDTTTGEPARCWDLGVDAWTIAPLELLPATGSASLSPDGLTLYYRALVNAEWVVFRTKRLTVDDPFDPAGEELFHSGTDEADYPEFVDATQELFYTGVGGDIYVTKREGMSWGAPKVAGGVMAFAQKYESHNNLSAEGAVLVFQRDDGQPFGQFKFGYNFYQLSRDPRSHVVFPDLPPAVVTPFDPGFGLSVCPALSPDGLHLFFSGFDSQGGGFGDPNDGRGGVWYARRDALTDGSWLDIRRSEQLREPGWVVCPVSVSADGCHLTLLYFKIEGGSAMDKIARRGDG